MKVLIDTNIILDFFLAREPHASTAKQIFAMMYKNEISAFTTASSITDVYYITAKRIGNSAARNAIAQLLKILGVIAVDGNDCAAALNLPMDDFEDAVIVSCASKEGINYIISNDKDFLDISQNLASVISPEDFFLTI